MCYTVAVKVIGIFGNDTNSILSTFLDLYGLDNSFPGFEAAAAKADLAERLETLECALHEAVIAHVGCRHHRFVPHIQPHEFEGLLFSDVDALCDTEPSWIDSVQQMRQVRLAFETPEHINNGYETKPSKRLEDILQPSYKKTRHGPLAAQRISLERIEVECPHFSSWLGKLRGLAH